MAEERKRFRERRDTAANWAIANPVLLLAERGLEQDTGKRKTGDGVTAWNSLAYDIVTDLPYASDAEVQAGSEATKLVNVVTGLNYLVRTPSFAGIQSVNGEVTFVQRVEATLAPRAGAQGNSDVVNKLALQSEIAGNLTADVGVGAGDAGKAPVLRSDGTLDLSFLPPGFSTLNYRGVFDPTDANGNGGNGDFPLEDVAGGGITPSASDGDYVVVTEDGFWDLGNGSSDPGPAGGTVIEVLTSDLLIFSTTNSAWARVKGSSLVASGLLQVSGANTMDGDLSFSSGARRIKFQGGTNSIEGQNDTNLADIRYVKLDCGSY